MNGATSLTIQGLSGGYGSGIVLREFSESATAGEVVCVLGRNGVGKSTLLKLVAGFLKSASGSITLQGRDLNGISPARRVAAGLSYGPQERVVFDDLSVAENLTLMQRRGNVARFAPYFDSFPRLAERLSQHAGTLSGGEKKLLSFVRVLSEGTAFVLFDEPTEGVQYENVMRMADLINARKRAGTAFIIVEQNLGFVEAIADRIVILDHGDIVLRGTAGSISREDIINHITV